MVFRKKKRVIFKFLPYEYKSLEEYLEKMAAKGWILEDINGYWLKFNKSKPKRLKYSVDIMDSISFLDREDAENILEYRDYCKKAGWKFVCGRNKRQIYCSEVNENRIDIHTDEIEKFNTIAKASLKYVGLNIITLVSILICSYILTIGNSDGYFLASMYSLNYLIFAIIFSIHEIIGIMTFLQFFIKGKKSINKGKKINYNFRKVVLVKRLLYYLLFSLLSMILVFFAIKYDINILKVGIIIVFLLCIFNYIVNFIRNKNYKNKSILIPLVYSILSLIIFFIISKNIINSASNRDYNYSNKKLENISHISLEDFNDTSKTDLLYNSIDRSPIASYLFYSNEGENIHLSYHIYESKYKWPVKYNFNKKIKFVNKIGIEYIEKETNLPKDIKVYMNEHGHQYIILSENKMVEIYNIETVSEDELINTVYEKVFK